MEPPCERRVRVHVSEMGPLRIRCLTVDGAILCERRVRVQGSDMSPLRIRCMTVELSEAELILWAVTHQPAMESTCEPQSAV